VFVVNITSLSIFIDATFVLIFLSQLEKILFMGRLNEVRHAFFFVTCRPLIYKETSDNEITVNTLEFNTMQLVCPNNTINTYIPC